MAKQQQTTVADLGSSWLGGGDGGESAFALLLHNAGCRGVVYQGDCRVADSSGVALVPTLTYGNWSDWHEFAVDVGDTVETAIHNGVGS
jgi:hypothetical protein